MHVYIIYIYILYYITSFLNIGATYFPHPCRKKKNGPRSLDRTVAIFVTSSAPPAWRTISVAVRKMLQTATRKARKVTTSRSVRNPWANGGMIGLVCWGKFTGNHRFSHWIWGFPVDFPLNQSIEEINSRPSPGFKPRDVTTLQDFEALRLQDIPET